PVRAAIEDEALARARRPAPPHAAHPALVGVVHAALPATRGVLVLEVAEDGVGAGAEAGGGRAGRVPREAPLGARHQLETNRPPALDRKLGESQPRPERGAGGAVSGIHLQHAAGETRVGGYP